MKMSDIQILRRKVSAMTVPNGEKINLLPGQEVLVLQEKGSSFTLNVMGNLVYLDGKDADAIGREVISLPSDNIKIKKSDQIKEDILWKQLKTIYDPEIPVNIVDLGLIYDLSWTCLEDKTYSIDVQMTLTAPACGMGPVLVENIKDKLELFNNISKVKVSLVFDPPWNVEMMSEEAKLELGLL